jgi:hypothetical protein
MIDISGGETHPNFMLNIHYNHRGRYRLGQKFALSIMELER